MTSRTHQIYNIVFEHGFDPPSPVRTMFRKTALFLRLGFPNCTSGAYNTLHVALVLEAPVSTGATSTSSKRTSVLEDTSTGAPSTSALAPVLQAPVL